MAADPFKVFAEGGRKQETLKALWPALYDALAGTAAPGEPEPPYVRWCVIAGHAGRHVPAVARTFEHGHTACARHIAEHADRPGGWPLRPERIPPR